MQLLNPCLHFTNNKFTIPTYIKEVFELPITLNSHTKLNFSSNNPYFCRIPPNITVKFTIIRELWRFLQPGPISYLKFEKKLGRNF